MELIVREKESGKHAKCLPGLVNILTDWRFVAREYNGEVYRNMCDYDIYIKSQDNWLDFIYAYKEGFLDPKQLRNWP